MDLEQLRTVLAAAQEGSLTAAARSRNLTQPAISLQLKALEQELGCPLFHRRGKGVVLTRAGETFAEHAREVLRTLSRARSEVAEIVGVTRGILRLGVTDAAATTLFPPAFGRFHGAYPQVEVRVEIHGTTRLSELLRSRELDLAIGTLPDPVGPHESIRITELYREPLGLVLPALDTKTPLRARLEEEPFMAYPEGSITRGLIDDALEKWGFTIRPSMEIGRPDAMIGMVEAGLGIAVLPESLCAPAVERGRVVRPNPKRYRVFRRLGLLEYLPEPLEPAARAFATMLKS